MRYRHCKLLLVQPSREIAKDVLKLNGKQLMTITVRITGHCGFRNHQCNIEFHAEELIYRLCHTGKEDVILHPRDVQNGG